jgi:tetratricopeptide (TPR) repeat protein
LAQEQEEIIIIEDSDAVSDAKENEAVAESLIDETQAKQKKLILFGGIAVIVVLLIAVTAVLLALKSKKDAKADKSIRFIENEIQKVKKPQIAPSKLENMIAKANYLYETGSKEKALSLYEQIATYSEAISDYNLGVAQLKEGQYELARKTFEKAIANREKICVSAINAAVCSLHLNDEENFRYYIDLAYAYLPYEIDSPLYSYYHTLINYYNKNYFAALNSLKNSTTQAYQTTQNNLSAKINALYNNNYDALDALERNSDDARDEFSLALLYARIGDFSLASSHLDNVIAKEKYPLKAPLALGLINLKAGHITKAAKEIKAVTDKFPKEVYKPYPIKVQLKKSLFDPIKAQQHYRKKLLESKDVIYQKIFYFSPYKVFNANQTISYIRKGNANIYIDNVESAQEYLKKSSASSSVNVGITKAIKKALRFKIREANEALQKLVKIQPKHSTLHYNLALTYAQLGDMKKANEHFLRSYYLDAKNYLSGIYAVMTAQLIDKDYYKLKSILKDSLALEEENEKTKRLKTLLYIAEGNYISAVEWLDKNHKQRPLNLILDITIASKLHRDEDAKDAATQLLAMQSNDILPNIIYMDTHFAKLSESDYAKETLKYLQSKHFNYADLYYGPFITRFLYIQTNLFTGRLYFLQQQLQKELISAAEDTRDLEAALALVYLYNQEFEKSYTLYNHLIDELKVQDANTLYLGAVASTAAQHHANAIALLELSKIKNPNFYESRYALALLYMEVANNDGAVIQLQRIKEDGFVSDYFEFNINTQKLLFEKEHQQK